MSHQGEPGQAGQPGEPGTAGGGRGGTGGAGGRGGAADTTITRGARYAAIFLFAFALVLAAANLLFTSREVNAVRIADTRAAHAAASVVQLCQAGNESRAQQVTLWDHLLTVAQPPPHETAAVRRRRLALTRAFAAYIHKVFAPRNCQHPLHP